MLDGEDRTIDGAKLRDDEQDRMERDYGEAVTAEPVSQFQVPITEDEHVRHQEDDDHNDEGNKVAAAKAMLFNNGGYPLLVFIASTVLMIAASSHCSTSKNCSGKNGYAVAAGVISMVVSIAYLWLEKQDHLEPKARLGLTIFLFLWWVLVAGITTFDAPFTVPGNGYFAAWGGLIGSLYMLTNEVAKVRAAIDRFSQVSRPISVLMVGSLVVLFAGVGSCGASCSGLSGYAIAAGTISFVMAFLRLFLESKLEASALKFFNLFLIVFWVVGFIILTFVNPFKSVGNGYFGTWACLIASVLLFNP